MLIDNFRTILQVEWRKQDSQIKMFSKPNCENGKEYSRITRPNDARLNYHELAQLYKLVAEWLCVNTRYVCDSIYICFADTKIGTRRVHVSAYENNNFL